jgi:hypothetical protein
MATPILDSPAAKGAVNSADLARVLSVENLAVFCGAASFGPFWKGVLEGRAPAVLDLRVSSVEQFKADFRAELWQIPDAACRASGNDELVVELGKQSKLNLTLRPRLSFEGQGYYCDSFAYPPDPEKLTLTLRPRLSFEGQGYYCDSFACPPDPEKLPPPNAALFEWRNAGGDVTRQFLRPLP